jgi:hypothetical protein
MSTEQLAAAMKYFLKKISIKAKFTVPLISGTWWIGKIANEIWQAVHHIF